MEHGMPISELGGDSGGPQGTQTLDENLSKLDLSEDWRREQFQLPSLRYHSASSLGTGAGCNHHQSGGGDMAAEQRPTAAEAARILQTRYENRGRTHARS